jgi:hypothetical protein
MTVWLVAGRVARRAVSSARTPARATTFDQMSCRALLGFIGRPVPKAREY